MNFNNRYTIWESLFEQDNREYIIIYKILGNRFQFRELSKINLEYINVNNRFRATLPNTLSSELSQFLENNKQEKLIAVKISSKDHFKAIETSIAKLSKDFDLYHLGFNGITNSIDSQVGVINYDSPEKASLLPSNYQIEGFTRGNNEIFLSLLAKVEKLAENNVSKESINKLMSGFRYLRMGVEAFELETKMLNYWIGLEYVFTSSMGEQSTIDRIRTYFPICHSLIYIRRNLHYFHKAIARVAIEDQIETYNDNLHYLGQHQSYDKVKALSPNFLLKRRAEELQKWTSDPNTIKNKLFSHENNLKWNISRLYRIRNEIVHNAATKSNIQTNVAHLKYYLNFILNSILDFLSQSPVDINNDGEVTIEDYFVAQDIILGALKGRTINDYIRVRNPTEIFH